MDRYHQLFPSSPGSQQSSYEDFMQGNFGCGLSRSSTSSSGFMSNNPWSPTSTQSFGWSPPSVTEYDPWTYAPLQSPEVVNYNRFFDEAWNVGPEGIFRKIEDNKFPYPSSCHGAKPWKELMDTTEDYADDFSLDMEVNRIEDEQMEEFTTFSPERASTPFNSLCNLTAPIFSSADKFQLPSHIKRRKRQARRKRNGKVQVNDLNHCGYCKSLGKVKAVYKSHTIKDSKGRCLCPALRQQECVICGEDGDTAHIPEECPIISEADYDYLRASNSSQHKAQRRLNFMQI